MATKKGPVDPLKAKEAKQKKIAIGGAVLLVILLVVQVPKLMKQLNQSSAPPPPPPASTTASPAPATSSPSAAPTTASGSSTGTGSLLSENAPTAAIGQLSSFGRFSSKDPFAAPAPAPSGPATTTTAKPPKNPPTPPTPPTPPAPPTTTSQTYTSALISVNGVKEQVAVGGNFPSSQPFFHLVSVSAHSAKISIAGGSLANGAPTVTLEEGKPLTLMNTTDGTRYKLVLLAQPSGGGTGSTTTTSSATPAAPATTTAATTTTKTTP